MADADSYYRVMMMGDGRNVNIMTPEGANAFIGNGETPFISTNINSLKPAREEMFGSPNTSRKHEIAGRLEQIYLMLGCLADNASPGVYARIPAQELECLMEHAMQVFTKLTTDPKWMMTGVLQKYDQELLECLIPSMKHASFVKLAFKKDLLTVLAKWCAARAKPAMPCVNVTEAVLSIVNNCRVTLMLAGEWNDEKSLKKLEATGILGQFLRCVTQPSVHPSELQGHLNNLDILMECTTLVKKKLKRGEPTGDALPDIIDYKDGYKGERNDAVMTRLRNIHKIACMSNDALDGGRLGKVLGKSCRKCNKTSFDPDFQMSLLVCSRCKETYYCSKECQRADWRDHKKTCSPADKRRAKAWKGCQSTVMCFVTDNYFDIMKEVERITRDGTVDKKDLVLEIDFFAVQGSAPALKDPPEFKLGITHRYLEGTRPDEPDWFYKGTDVYENNIRQFLVGLKDHFQRMTSNHLLAIARHPNGNSAVYRLQLMSEEGIGARPIFSDEAVDAFRHALGGDNSRLSRVYAPPQQASIERRILMEHTDERLRNEMSQSEDGDAELQQILGELMASDRFRELARQVEGQARDPDDSKWDANKVWMYLLAIIFLGLACLWSSYFHT